MFQINAEDLPLLEAFPFLRRVISYNNSDWPVVYQNLRKAQKWRGVVARVLSKIEATVRAQGMMYKAVDQ